MSVVLRISETVLREGDPAGVMKEILRRVDEEDVRVIEIVMAPKPVEMEVTRTRRTLVT